MDEPVYDAPPLEVPEPSADVMPRRETGGDGG